MFYLIIIMIDKEDFRNIRKDLESFDSKREEVINLSRKIIRLSKQAIYAVHRRDLPKAAKMIAEMKKNIAKLPKGKYDTGIDNVAIQEYVEAVCLYRFVKDKKIPTRQALNVETEGYLLGLCDLSGELVRLAVNEAIRKNYERAFEIKDFLTELYGEFLKFDLRGGELRKKSDSIKWNLQKLEDLTLELSSRE